MKVKGQEVALTPNEFDILYTLAANKGMVLSRQQIIDKVFGMDFEGFDRTIDVHVKKYQKKIEDDKKPKIYFNCSKSRLQVWW